MTIRVYELRFTSIWVEAFSGLVPPDAPMGFLADPVRYGREFEKARSGSSSWKLPWPKPVGHNFWEYYLGKKALGSVGSDKAWKYMVPFWTPSLCKAELSAPIYRMRVEGFYYPCCAGVVITSVIRGDLSLDDMVRAALNTYERHYELQWSTGERSHLSLKETASEALDRLRMAALGDTACRERPLAEPFIVATVIDGQVDDLTMANPNNGEVHRRLEALLRRHPNWDTNPLHLLDENTSFKFKDKEYSQPSHLLYGLKQGRAVWFPGYFGKAAGKKIRTLGCYHRNLTLASLQTAGLITLMELAADFIKPNATMPSVIRALAKPVSTRLKDLYRAVADKTYRSWSPYRQIKDGEFNKVIDTVMDSLGGGRLDP